MKNKGLFDHIGHITQKQTKGYWNSLNETEKKQWSNYMIHRFLSMKMEWTDFINEIQKLNLKPKHLYAVYSSILPKGKQYLKYIKNKKQTNYSKQVIQQIAEYFEISQLESEDYLNLLSKEQVRELVSKYGYTSKELKQIGL